MWNLDDEGGLFLQVLVFTLKTYSQQWIWKCSTLSHRKSLLQMRTHKHYYNKQNIIILWDLQPLPVERTLVIHHSRAPMIPTDKTKGFRKKQSNIFLWTRILYDIKMCHFFYLIQPTLSDPLETNIQFLSRISIQSNLGIEVFTHGRLKMQCLCVAKIITECPLTVRVSWCYCTLKSNRRATRFSKIIN